MKWNYIINKGLSYCNGLDIELSFDMTRNLTREKLLYKPEVNSGRFDNEDSYEGLFGISKHWLRLGFKDDKLFDIEVLNGVVVFSDVEIQTHSDLQNTLALLRAKGHVFEETDYSYNNRLLKIDLGDSEKNGGISNLIYWILVAKNFDYMNQD